MHFGIFLDAVIMGMVLGSVRCHTWSIGLWGVNLIHVARSFQVSAYCEKGAGIIDRPFQC